MSERLVLGKSQELQAMEHLARYEFAAQFAEGKEAADIACGSGYGALMMARRSQERSGS